MSALGRSLTLVRARLGGARGEELPVAPLFLHGVIAAALAWVARGDLSPFAYGVHALTVVGVLVALPLLGELGHLLRADPAEEWVGALAIAPRELRVARALIALCVLAWLALGSLVPAVLLAPAGTGLAGRAALAAGGLGLVAALAASLLVLQAALGERAEAALVLVQTALFGGAVLGFVLAGRLFPALAGVDALGDAHWTLAYPPAWFAAPLGGGGAAAWATPLVASALAALALVLVPPAPARRAARREPLLARILRPVRALATRAWVRPDERAPFDLVYDALPLEREVVLRTYPLFGVPVAFLLAGASGASPATASDLFAVLFFTSCIYLPVLLLHVPASESHRARWLLETHPIPPSALAGGVIKALALRFLLPLYVVLALLGWAYAGVAVVARLALPGFLIAVLVLRMLYPGTVRDLPLSVAPDRVETRYDWGGVIAVNGLALTVAAVLVNRFLPGVAHGIALSAGLLALEWLAERRLRARAA